MDEPLFSFGMRSDVLSIRSRSIGLETSTEPERNTPSNVAEDSGEFDSFLGCAVAPPGRDMLGSGGGITPGGAPLRPVGVADMGYTEVIVVEGLKPVGLDPKRDISPDLSVGRSSLS